jgi:hypothetical protein
MPSILTDRIPDIEAMAQPVDKANKALAAEVMEWFDELRGKRAIWDTLWQEVRALVRPNAEDFTRKQPAAIGRKQRIYDDHPTTCLNILTAGIQSNATNAASRWFALTSGDYYLDRRPEVARYLETISNVGYDEIYHPDAGFNPSSHELYSDWGGFGTAVFNFLESDDRVHFRTIPLAECYISENDYGIVDVLFRKFTLSKRAAIMKFGDRLPKDVREGATKEDPIEFIHAVYPIDSDVRFRSVYVHAVSLTVVSEGMFQEFPYCVLRWTKMAGDVYGRSPGTDCLQTVRVLNEKVRVGLQQDQLISAPPIISEDDGVLSTVVLQPWGNIRIRSGSQFPKTLDVGGNLNASRESIQDIRQSISTAFYNDLFEGTDYGNRDRVTGQEVQVDSSSKMRRIAPITNRMEIEFLGPLIKRIYNFLQRKGKLPPMPMALKGRKLKIQYLSPASQALRAIKAQNTLKFIETVVPFMQYDPQILDSIDMDKVMTSTGFAMDIEQSATRSSDDVVALRQQRAKSQQQQQQGEQAMNATQGMLNVAQARKADPSLGGLLQQ